MRLSQGGASRGRVAPQPLFVLGLLAVLLVVSLLASGRWGRCGARQGARERPG